MRSGCCAWCTAASRGPSANRSAVVRGSIPRIRIKGAHAMAAEFKLRHYSTSVKPPGFCRLLFTTFLENQGGLALSGALPVSLAEGQCFPPQGSCYQEQWAVAGCPASKVWSSGARPAHTCLEVVRRGAE
ncbi:hypothetical protein K438DRAFT_1747352 [Mycena galopus ATCC 62051]|nr:hypothetical protein K438DRAFT_1747352 [Mycena galopus ATCC 62051]